MLLFVTLCVVALKVTTYMGDVLKTDIVDMLPCMFRSTKANKLAPSLAVKRCAFVVGTLLMIKRIKMLHQRFSPIRLFRLLINFMFNVLVSLGLCLLS